MLMVNPFELIVFDEWVSLDEELLVCCLSYRLPLLNFVHWMLSCAPQSTSPLVSDRTELYLMVVQWTNVDLDYDVVDDDGFWKNYLHKFLICDACGGGGGVGDGAFFDGHLDLAF